MKRIIRPTESLDSEKLHTDLNKRSVSGLRPSSGSGWFDVRQWVRASSARPALLLSLLGTVVILGAAYTIFASPSGFAYSISSVNALPPPNMAPGQQATISFTLKNTGTSPWYRNTTSPYGQFNLRTDSGNCACLPDNISLPVTVTRAGDTVRFSMAFTAPGSPGSFNEQYKIHILNKGDIDPVPININFKTTVPGPPAVSMTGPANGSRVSGTIAASANASVGAGVSLVGVQFRIDGRSLGAEDTGAPYAVSFDTHTLSNGTHSINALARDSSGRSTTSDTVTFTVANSSPSSGGSGQGGSSGGGGSSTVTGPFVTESPPIDTTAPDITSVVPEVSQPQDNTQNNQTVATKPKSCNLILASLSGGILGDAICTLKHLVVK